MVAREVRCLPHGPDVARGGGERVAIWPDREGHGPGPSRIRPLRLGGSRSRAELPGSPLKHRWSTVESGPRGLVWTRSETLTSATWSRRLRGQMLGVMRASLGDALGRSERASIREVPALDAVLLAGRLGGVFGRPGLLTAVLRPGLPAWAATLRPRVNRGAAARRGAGWRGGEDGGGAGSGALARAIPTVTHVPGQKCYPGSWLHKTSMEFGPDSVSAEDLVRSPG